MAVNPWAHDKTESEFAQPAYPVAAITRYAVPDISEGSAYNDEFGWSPTPRKVPGNTPDPARLGEQPLRQHYPNANRPPEEYYGELSRDVSHRSTVEQIDADGWSETKAYPGYPSAAAGANRFAPNPRRVPPPEPRLTSLLAPRTYSFVRPFGSGARRFTGEHFSMADHSRNYEILGMRPASARRNTYRLEPTPWDTNIIDMPPTSSPVEGTNQAVEVAYVSRSWRL